jgi:hypothetical protein
MDPIGDSRRGSALKRNVSEPQLFKSRFDRDIAEEKVSSGRIMGNSSTKSSAENFVVLENVKTRSF